MTRDSSIGNSVSTSSRLASLPCGLFVAIQNAGDRIVSKASQLIGNHTSNICENFMSVRGKMDGGKVFNRIQSGSFQHRSMAAALRLQLGPGWVSTVWEREFGEPGNCSLTFRQNIKQKFQLEKARKTSDKYKRQRLTKKLSH